MLMAQRSDKQLAKVHNSLLNTAQSASNHGLFFDEYLIFTDQISPLSKSCYYHIRLVTVFMLGTFSFVVYLRANNLVFLSLPGGCNCLQSVISRHSTTAACDCQTDRCTELSYLYRALHSCDMLTRDKKVSAYW